MTLSALEELGLVGAASVVRAVEVRYAIALDVGAAGDIPSVDPLDAPVRLGGGLIVVQKGHIPYTRSLTLAIEHAAGSAGIPFQRAVFEQLGTDASELIRSGVAAAAIAIPTRYTHSPFEMVDERDLLACVRLLKAVVAGGFRAGRDRA